MKYLGNILIILLFTFPASSQVCPEIKCDDSCNLSLYDFSLLSGEYESTSCLEDKKNPGRYCPDRAFDKDIMTSWVEGKKGSGINEKLAFHIKSNINQISILPGFGDLRYFKMNNRLKKVSLSIYKITMAGATECSEIVYHIGKRIKTCSLDFRDSMTMQTFNIGIKDVGKYKEPWESGNIVERGYVGVIEIIEIYPGSKWSDTCIAEVVVK